MYKNISLFKWKNHRRQSYDDWFAARKWTRLKQDSFELTHLLNVLLKQRWVQLSLASQLISVIAVADIAVFPHNNSIWFIIKLKHLSADSRLQRYMCFGPWGRFRGRKDESKSERKSICCVARTLLRGYLRVESHVTEDLEMSAIHFFKAERVLLAVRASCVGRKADGV